MFDSQEAYDRTIPSIQKRIFYSSLIFEFWWAQARSGAQAIRLSINVGERSSVTSSRQKERRRERKEISAQGRGR